MDKLDNLAEQVKAVNSVKISDGYKIGYNTDVSGFTNSISPLLKDYHKKGLILGTGGAAKAVAYSLKLLGIEYVYISRKRNDNSLRYDQLTKEIIKEHLLIINATPLGMGDKINLFPAIPYESISTKHLLFDLVYNPNETLFLKKGRERGGVTENGLQMLHLQAEESWKIWNKE